MRGNRWLVPPRTHDPQGGRRPHVNPAPDVGAHRLGYTLLARPVSRGHRHPTLTPTVFGRRPSPSPASEGNRRSHGRDPDGLRPVIVHGHHCPQVRFQSRGAPSLWVPSYLYVLLGPVAWGCPPRPGRETSGCGRLGSCVPTQSPGRCIGCLVARQRGSAAARQRGNAATRHPAAWFHDARNTP